MTAFEPLVRWLIFSVIFALLPVFSKALVLFTGLMSTSGSVQAPVPALTFGEVLARTCGDGELLLVATAIAAAGIGEIVSSVSQNRRLARVVIGGSLLLIVALSSLWYAIIVGSQTSLDAALVAQGSLVVWFSAVTAAAASVVISALDEVV